MRSRSTIYPNLSLVDVKYLRRTELVDHQLGRGEKLAFTALYEEARTLLVLEEVVKPEGMGNDRGRTLRLARTRVAMVRKLVVIRPACGQRDRSPLRKVCFGVE